MTVSILPQSSHCRERPGLLAHGASVKHHGARGGLPSHQGWIQGGQGSGAHWPRGSEALLDHGRTLVEESYSG